MILSPELQGRAHALRDALDAINSLAADELVDITGDVEADNEDLSDLRDCLRVLTREIAANPDDERERLWDELEDIIVAAEAEASTP